MIVFIAGLILALGGVGGVELSTDTPQLLGSTLIACLGLLAMYAAVLGLRNSDFYDTY
jgi:glycosyltransferase A (GT-A) superfamily protein (DUF2064 family)